MFQRININSVKRLIKIRGSLEVTMSEIGKDPNNTSMGGVSQIQFNLKSVDEIEPAIQKYREFCGKRNARPWYHIWIEED